VDGGDGGSSWSIDGRVSMGRDMESLPGEEVRMGDL
jgi:hypothetical protein